MKSPIKIINGDYAEAARSSVVVVTAGEATSGPDVSWLDLLSKNIEIVRDIVGKLKAEGFAGILVMASNPVDRRENTLPWCLHPRSCGSPVVRKRSTGKLVQRLSNLGYDVMLLRKAA